MMPFSCKRERKSINGLILAVLFSTSGVVAPLLFRLLLLFSHMTVDKLLNISPCNVYVFYLHDTLKIS